LRGCRSDKNCEHKHDEQLSDVMHQNTF
jgi:hypothetical protein